MFYYIPELISKVSPSKTKAKNEHAGLIVKNCYISICVVIASCDFWGDRIYLKVYGKHQCLNSSHNQVMFLNSMCCHVEICGIRFLSPQEHTQEQEVYGSLQNA